MCMCMCMCLCLCMCIYMCVCKYIQIFYYLFSFVCCVFNRIFFLVCSSLDIFTIQFKQYLNITFNCSVINPPNTAPFKSLITSKYD